MPSGRWPKNGVLVYRETYAILIVYEKRELLCHVYRVSPVSQPCSRGGARA